MEGASPARLYATLIGSLLVIVGIVGFFYSASFGSPGRVEDALGIFSVNAWQNLFHILCGAIGLLLAGYAARQYALGMGALFLVVAVWGFLLGGDDAILGFLPISPADDFLHLILGLLGIAGALATPGPKRAPSAPGRKRPRPKRPRLRARSAR